MVMLLVTSSNCGMPALHKGLAVCVAFAGAMQVADLVNKATGHVQNLS